MRAAVRRETEPWRFPEHSFALLDRVVAGIRPDDRALDGWLAAYCREHRTRLAADLRILERHVAPRARILEYGAIPLVMTAALAALDYEVSAVDVKPVFTLREAWRVLVPGGTLLLSTPNLRSLRGIRNLLLRNQGHAVSGGVYEQYEKLDTLGHMGHVREYTTREVSDVLARVGFRVETMVFRGGHGKGVVGIAERLAPALRPFFTLIASKDRPQRGEDAAGRP
jgi:SAM-dependent methyltransferase